MNSIYIAISIVFSFYVSWWYLPSVADVGFFSKLTSFILGSGLGYVGSMIGNIFNGFSFGVLGSFIATIFGSAIGAVIVAFLFG